jgi:hypothetical protein
LIWPEYIPCRGKRKAGKKNQMMFLEEDKRPSLKIWQKGFNPWQ